MNSKNEKLLLDFLGENGLVNFDLALEITEKMRLRLPSFTARLVKDFGEEQMTYQLRLIRDVQLDAYRLDSYRAIHRHALPIGQDVINGVNTAALETRMKELPWEQFFGGKLQGGDLSQWNFHEPLALLNKLSEGQDMQGFHVQEMLKFKYWPKEANDVASRKSLEARFESGRDFYPGETGITSATLAFQYLSGRLDDIHTQLMATNMGYFPGVNLYLLLEKELAKDPDAFTVRLQRNEKEGLLEYEVPIKKVSGQYMEFGYTAKFTPYNNIRHGVYEGIDTALLEAQMQQINWKKDTQFLVFGENAEPQIRPHVMEIQDAIYKLGQNPEGMVIADQLQLKYWIGVTFFEDMITDTAWKNLETLPVRQMDFAIDTEMKVAYNLLDGRPVHQSMLYPSRHNPAPDNWATGDFDHTNADGTFALRIIEGFPKIDLNRFVDNISSADQFHVLMRAFLRGDLVDTTLRTGQAVHLIANPQQQRVDFFSLDMRPIPVNINFDPDWPTPGDLQSMLDRMRQNRTVIPPPKNPQQNKRGR